MTKRFDSPVASTLWQIKTILVLTFDDDCFGSSIEEKLCPLEIAARTSFLTLIKTRTLIQPETLVLHCCISNTQSLNGTVTAAVDVYKLYHRWRAGGAALQLHPIASELFWRWRNHFLERKFLECSRYK